jgi:hypothetical protein
MRRGPDVRRGRMNRRGPGESGFAMITSVIVILMTAALALIILTNGEHADRSSQRGRNWELAIQHADAGVQQAVAKLQAGNGAVPAAFTGTTAEGSYSVTVTYLGRKRYQIDAQGFAGTHTSLAADRSVRVIYGPPRSFNYALFSLTDIDTKNNDTVDGDIWANGSVRVDQNDIITGSVNAATGWVFLDNGSSIAGDVVSGGYDPATNRSIEVSTGALISGKVTAASTVPGCTDDVAHSAYHVHATGDIAGTVKTWGVKTGGGSTGTVTTGVCSAAPATKPMPTFTYNPANYSPAPTEFADVASFNAFLAASGTSLEGTYYVEGSGAIDLNGVTIAGDTTIIAVEAAIDAFGGVGVAAANNNDKILVLVSYYQPAAGTACTNTGGNPLDCAIGIKNNFQPENNTATLLYAPNGPVAFKNNAEFDGAVYANDIVLKNNMELVYDARVEQIIGFGSVSLELESWIEV